MKRYLLILILLSCMFPIVPVYGIEIDTHDSIDENDGNTPGTIDQIEDGINDPTIPLDLLLDWLNIPVRLYDSKFNILIFGGGVSNIALQSADFGNQVRYVIPDVNTGSDGIGEESANFQLIEFLISSTYTLFPNMTITWINTEFNNLEFNGIYRKAVVDLVRSEVEINNLTLSMVFGEYFGHPIDKFNELLLEFSSNNIPVVTTAITTQTGGDLLSPGNNPKLISIGNLLLDDLDVRQAFTAKNFQLQHPTAISGNNLTKTNPDFVLPGVSIAATNGSSITVNSLRLPVIVFAIGLLSSIERYPKMTISEVLGMMRGSSVEIQDINSFQQGYGIPQFVNSGRTRMKSFSFNPIGNSIATSGQTLMLAAEFSNDQQVILDRLDAVHEGVNISVNFDLIPSYKAMDYEINTFYPGNYVWNGGIFLNYPIIIPDLPQNSALDIIAHFKIDGQQMIQTRELVIDNNYRLIAGLEIFEGDGFYSRESFMGKLYPIFIELFSNQWALSIFQNRVDLTTEVESMNNDIVLVIDPDSSEFDNVLLLDKYIENYGNVLIIYDHNPFLEIISNDTRVMGNYPNHVDLKRINRKYGISISEFNPNFLHNPIYENGVPSSHSAFYTVPWTSNNNSDYLSFPQVPMRGYEIDASEFNQVEQITNYDGSINIMPVSENNGYLAVLGTPTPFVPKFDSINKLIDVPKSGDLSNAILTLASGLNGTINVDPDFRWFNEVIRLDLSTELLYNVNPRWQIIVESEDLSTRPFTLNDTSISIRPSLFVEGHLSLNISLAFNGHTIDKTSVKLTYSISRFERYSLFALWGLFSVAVYYLVNKIKETNMDLANYY